MGALGTNTTYAILKFEQLISKKLILYDPSNNKFAMGFDGLRDNYTAVMDWLVENGRGETLWFDEGMYLQKNESQSANINI